MVQAHTFARDGACAAHTLHLWSPAHAFAVQASVAAAMATGVANRVLYKMALVPMGNYVFVLSQFQTFGYLLVYFGILAARYK